MQCVGREHKLHRKERYPPGTGVVISAGAYRKLRGKILVLGGVVRRLGLKGRMPRPFEVVHSGSTTIEESGLSLISLLRGTSLAPGAGLVCGGVRARKMALKREICSTRRVDGYEAVNMGSKIAAR